AAGLLLVGCGEGDDGGGKASQQVPPAETETPRKDDTDEPSDGAGEDDACHVHLFDGDNFDEDDEHFKHTERGTYESLADLPGADRDWTDEADSIKVGKSATLTIYSEENFDGTSQDLEPGSEHADVDDEPRSLEMSCD